MRFFLIVLFLSLISLFSVKLKIHVIVSSDPAKLEVEFIPVFLKMRKKFGLENSSSSWRKMLQHNTLNINHYWDLSRLTFKYLIIKRLVWKSIIGLNDAMETALAAGALWVFKGVVASCLSSKSRLDGLELEVIPDFKACGFHSRLSCILKIRIAHIILIMIYYASLVLRRYIGGKTTTGSAEPPH